MKIRRVSEYETTCVGCGAKLRIMADEVDFSRGFADQRLGCPVCKANVLVLRDGMVPETLAPKVYAGSWEGVKDGEQKVLGN